MYRREVEVNLKKRGAGRDSFVCTCLRHSKRQTVHLFVKKGCDQAEAWSDKKKSLSFDNHLRIPNTFASATHHSHHLAPNTAT